MPTITWSDIDGWFDYQNIYDAELSRVRSGVFVEVGTWLGRSAAYMASAIQRSGKPIKFFVVDTFGGTPSDPYMSTYARNAGGSILDEWRSNMEACGVSEFVEPLVSDSSTAADRFADESIDFCFIDANHDAGACLRDIRAWLPKIKPCGTLAGHDIDYDTVRADLHASGLRFFIDHRSWVYRKKPPLRHRDDIRRLNDMRASRS